MKARRVFRANQKTAEERAREQALRERLQKEKPTLEDLVRTGECDPDAVMTMGMYFDVQTALQALKRNGSCGPTRNWRARVRGQTGKQADAEPATPPDRGEELARGVSHDPSRQ